MSLISHLAIVSINQLIIFLTVLPILYSVKNSTNQLIIFLLTSTILLLEGNSVNRLNISLLTSPILIVKVVETTCWSFPSVIQHVTTRENLKWDWLPVDHLPPLITQLTFEMLFNQTVDYLPLNITQIVWDGISSSPYSPTNSRKQHQRILVVIPTMEVAGADQFKQFNFNFLTRYTKSCAS
jgi:hypothetical protein